MGTTTDVEEIKRIEEHQMSEIRRVTALQKRLAKDAASQVADQQADPAASGNSMSRRSVEDPMSRFGTFSGLAEQDEQSAVSNMTGARAQRRVRAPLPITMTRHDASPRSSTA